MTNSFKIIKYHFVFTGKKKFSGVGILFFPKVEDFTVKFEYFSPHWQGLDYAV